MAEFSSVFEKLPPEFTRNGNVWGRNIGGSWECFQDYGNDLSYVNPKFAIHGNKVIISENDVCFYFYDKYVGSVIL